MVSRRYDSQGLRRAHWTVCAHKPRQTRTFGNFAAIEALTSATVASGVTSIVRGKPRAKEGGFDAESIVSETIAVVVVLEHVRKRIRN